MAFSSKLEENIKINPNKINSRELKFNDYKLSIADEDQLRIDFYKSILHKEDSSLVLYSLKKSAKARNNLTLFEDITLELCGELKINNNYGELFNQINECIILEKPETFRL